MNGNLFWHAFLIVGVPGLLTLIALNPAIKAQVTYMDRRGHDPMTITASSIVGAVMVYLTLVLISVLIVGGPGRG